MISDAVYQVWGKSLIIMLFGYAVKVSSTKHMCLGSTLATLTMFYPAQNIFHLH